MRIFAQKPKATQQTTSAKSAIPGWAHFGQSREVNSIFHLQHTIGNQAVQRLLKENTGDVKGDSTTTEITRFGHDFSRIPIRTPAAGAIQTKLAINKPGDEYEHEAVHIADQVMRMAEPVPIGATAAAIQRKCARCEDEKDKGLPAKATFFGAHRWQDPPQNVGYTNGGQQQQPQQQQPQQQQQQAPQNCGTAFTGHTFALSNQTGSGASPAASASQVSAGGKPYILFRGIAPASYSPTATVAGPNASDYEAGLMQNVLTGTRNAVYDTGVTVSTQPATLPIKDGAPSSSGMYDIDFAENGTGTPGVLVRFGASGSQASLRLPDTPGGGGFLNLLDDSTCQGPYREARLTRLRFNDTFRTWVGVRHRPTGCVRTIHHIDWETDWDLMVGSGTPPSLTFAANNINVSQSNGNGSPAYIRGGPVPADGISKTCQ